MALGVDDSLVHLYGTDMDGGGDPMRYDNVEELDIGRRQFHADHVGHCAGERYRFLIGTLWGVIVDV